MKKVQKKMLRGVDATPPPAALRASFAPAPSLRESEISGSPQETALLIIDAQNYNCTRAGALWNAPELDDEGRRRGPALLFLEAPGARGPQRQPRGHPELGGPRCRGALRRGPGHLHRWEEELFRRREREGLGLGLGSGLWRGGEKERKREREREKRMGKNLRGLFPLSFSHKKQKSDERRHGRGQPRGAGHEYRLPPQRLPDPAAVLGRATDRRTAARRRRRRGLRKTPRARTPAAPSSSRRRAATSS